MAHTPHIVQDGEAAQPWDRLPDEHNKAWEWFQAYRNLPASERSLKAAQRAMGKRSSRRAEVWSSKFNWVERAAAWDERVDKATQEALLDDLVEIRRKQLEKLEGVGQLVARELAAMIRRSAQADKHTPERDTPLLSVTEIRSLLELQIRCQRLILGQSTEHTETEEAYDPSKYTTEELRTIRKLRGELQNIREKAKR